jgi:hypothetical protein
MEQQVKRLLLACWEVSKSGKRIAAGWNPRYVSMAAKSHPVCSLYLGLLGLNMLKMCDWTTTAAFLFNMDNTVTDCLHFKHSAINRSTFIFWIQLWDSSLVSKVTTWNVISGCSVLAHNTKCFENAFRHAMHVNCGTHNFLKCVITWSVR